MLQSMLSILSSTKYEICVTHYYRGRNKDDNTYKRFHRAIFLITEPSSDPPRGTVYQVIHGRPIFEYMTRSDIDITQKQMEKYSGKITIGEVKKGDVRKLGEILAGVTVVRDINSDWSCQAWTRDGVKQLVENGLVDESWSDSKLEKELQKGETDYIATLEQSR